PPVMLRSFRFLAGSAAHGERVEREAYAVERAGQQVPADPVSDAQETIHAEMLAGNDEHVLLDTEPLGELGGGDVVQVAHVADRAGIGRAVDEGAIGPGPAFEAVQPVPEEGAGPLEESRADVRIEREGRKAVGEPSGRDRRIIRTGP